MAPEPTTNFSGWPEIVYLLAGGHYALCDRGECPNEWSAVDRWGVSVGADVRGLGGAGGHHVKVVVCVEGGSTRKTERVRFLLAKRTFRRKGVAPAGKPTPASEVVACGSRGETLRKFRAACLRPPEAKPVLLVDSWGWNRRGTAASRDSS